MKYFDLMNLTRRYTALLRNKKTIYVIPLLCALLTPLLTFGPKRADASISKETQLKLLKLEEARVSLVHAMEEEQKYLDDWLNLKNLYQEDVVTGKEVTEAEAEKNQATQKLELAIVDLSKTYLSFLQEATHLTLTDTFQFIDANNDRHIQMTVMNTSDIGLATVAYRTLDATYKELDGYLSRRNKRLSDYRDALKKSSGAMNSGSDSATRIAGARAELTALDKDISGFSKKLDTNKIKRADIPGLMTIEDLYVSITVGGVTVSSPFETRVAKLPYNKSQTLDFKLNQDVDQVTINLNYQNVKDQRNIKVERRQTEDVVRVSSTQFSQEGKLGNWVSYDIKLERMAEDQKTVMMEVIDLPRIYKYEFSSQGNQLSRVKFEKGVSDQSLTLKVFVPDQLDDNKIRKAVSFFIVVGDDAAVQSARDLVKNNGAGSASADVFKALKLGYEALELTPRGVGELELTFANLIKDTLIGDEINDKFTVKNTGSAKLDNIRFNIEKPGANWVIEVKPLEVMSLDPNKEKQLEIKIAPPDDAEVGKYEVKIKAVTDFEGSAMETEQKTIVVNVSAKTNLKYTMTIAMAIIAAILGVAIFTIKLSRR